MLQQLNGCAPREHDEPQPNATGAIAAEQAFCAGELSVRVSFARGVAVRSVVVVIVVMGVTREFGSVCRRRIQRRFPVRTTSGGRLTTAPIRRNPMKRTKPCPEARSGYAPRMADTYEAPRIEQRTNIGATLIGNQIASGNTDSGPPPV